MASSTTASSPQQSSVDENTRPYDPFADESSSGNVRKKSNWFKRNSKSGDDKTWGNPDKKNTSMPYTVTNNAARHISEEKLVVPAKKKGFDFGRIFGRRSLKLDGGMSTAGKSPIPRVPYGIINLKCNIEIEIRDSASIVESIAEEQWRSHVGRATNFENPTRQIEPHQNWLARLFHVKPAMRYICFSASKRRARQEISSLLKEWRKYGARDIVVDKERNIVFGRVGPQNCEFLETSGLISIQQ
jgi:hypothetical protein